MTEVEFKAVINALAPPIKDFLMARVGPLETRLKGLEADKRALENRLVELEAKEAARGVQPHGE